MCRPALPLHAMSGLIRGFGCRRTAMSPLIRGGGPGPRAVGCGPVGCGPVDLQACGPAAGGRAGGRRVAARRRVRAGPGAWSAGATARTAAGRARRWSRWGRRHDRRAASSTRRVRAGTRGSMRSRRRWSSPQSWRPRRPARRRARIDARSICLRVDARAHAHASWGAPPRFAASPLPNYNRGA